MEINIRKALPEDAYDFATCVISCFQTAYKGIITDEYLHNMIIEKDKQIERYKKSLTDPGDCVYYCVMYEEKMIGFITININYEDNIWAIYLLEEFRGKGYGKIMLDFAVNELKNIGQKEIALWVFEENIKARFFYEKNNFKFSGKKREMEYGKPLVQLLYVLKP